VGLLHISCPALQRCSTFFYRYCTVVLPFFYRCFTVTAPLFSQHQPGQTTATKRRNHALSPPWPSCGHPTTPRATTLTLSGIDPLLLTKPDPPSRHGCAHENAAHTAIPERTRLYTASRVRCAGLQKPQPALDPAPRRKPGCWRAPTVGQFP
jgi:hypothetical protein